MKITANPYFREQGYIDGLWCNAKNNETVDVIDPATGAIVQPAANAGAALRVIIAAGKFQGVIAAQTPIPCLIIGRLLMRQCSDSVKKVSLELGGNAPFIVFNNINNTRRDTSLSG